MPWQTFQPWVVSLAHTPFAEWLGKSTVRIGVLLTLHLVGITVFLGSVVYVSFHLLGFIDRSKPLAAVRRDLLPVTAVGLVLVLSSGALTFTGGAVEYYATPWFRTKMLLLAVALIVQIVVFRLARTAPNGFGRWPGRLAGALMLLAWFSVGFAGRAIAYF